MGLFDSFGAQSGGFDPQQFMAANGMQSMNQQPMSGFQPSNGPVQPAGPLDTSLPNMQAPQQGFLAQMGANAQNMGGLGQALRDPPQQQPAGPSMLQQGIAALMQQQPQLASHPVLQHLFQMPSTGGR